MPKEGVECLWSRALFSATCSSINWPLSTGKSVRAAYDPNARLFTRGIAHNTFWRNKLGRDANHVGT